METMLMFVLALLVLQAPTQKITPTYVATASFVNKGDTANAAEIMFGRGDGDNMPMAQEWFDPVRLHGTITVPLRAGERVELFIGSDEGFGLHPGGNPPTPVYMFSSDFAPVDPEKHPGVQIVAQEIEFLSDSMYTGGVSANMRVEKFPFPVGQKSVAIAQPLPGDSGVERFALGRQKFLISCRGTDSLIFRAKEGVSSKAVYLPGNERVRHRNARELKVECRDNYIA